MSFNRSLLLSFRLRHWTCSEKWKWKADDAQWKKSWDAHPNPNLNLWMHLEKSCCSSVGTASHTQIALIVPRVFFTKEHWLSPTNFGIPTLTLLAQCLETWQYTICSSHIKLMRTRKNYKKVYAYSRTWIRKKLRASHSLRFLDIHAGIRRTGRRRACWWWSSSHALF